MYLQEVPLPYKLKNWHQPNFSRQYFKISSTNFFTKILSDLNRLPRGNHFHNQSHFPGIIKKPNLSHVLLMLIVLLELQTVIWGLERLLNQNWRDSERRNHMREFQGLSKPCKWTLKYQCLSLVSKMLTNPILYKHLHWAILAHSQITFSCSWAVALRYLKICNFPFVQT